MIRILYIFVILLFSTIVNSQSINSWTEENGILGLGYPVPIPVDTPEPFDGFRTYAGLFAKHQMIEQENPNVNGHIVGQTINNRDIWAYEFSDENNYTKYGVKEGVMMINGGIHAREWQSPEVVTGVMELLHDHSNDQSLHQFLLENTNMIILPVNNVDGLLQTQRYSTDNYYPTSSGPRDGRMRRKNMRNVDEILSTNNDYLFGIDLNRNNDPYWATSSGSSGDVTSLVHHGAFAHSEPETIARLNAADLASPTQFRAYTDAHSFSSVLYSVRIFNQNHSILQSQLMNIFSSHHRNFEAGRVYTDVPSPAGSGIGSTDEYFANNYQIPSWTLEIEPGGNAGAEYGGFNNDGHDGFILPESEIRRVREELAQTFMVAWYAQAGPPSITQFRVMDVDSKAIIYDAEWDIEDGNSRSFYENSIENLIPGHRYQLLIRFDKPMRKRNENGVVVPLQGMPVSTLNPLDPTITARIDGTTVTLIEENPDNQSVKKNWIQHKSSDFESYGYYKDDSYIYEFHLQEDVSLNEESKLEFSINVADMVNQSLDSNPTTAVTWINGTWANYENSANNLALTGGEDSSYSVPVSLSSKNTYPAVIQNTGLYYDPNRSGEGFSYELLSYAGSIWLQWFTYDDQGQQRWYSDLENFYGNTIVMNDINAGMGGVFGDAFDSDLIRYTSIGDLEIIFSGGVDRVNPINLHTIDRTAAVKFTDIEGNKLRTTLNQLSFILNNASDIYQPTPPSFFYGISSYTGSWYDPNRSGEGYIIEILEDYQAVLLWYTYDLEGNHLWLLDSGGQITDTENGLKLDFNNVFMTRGPKFGNEFDASDLEIIPWGEVSFDLNCEFGIVNYNSNVEGFGQGEHSIVKLTHPLNVEFCK